MTGDDTINLSEEAQVALSEHIQRLKTYREAIKRGAKTGISKSFGSALELLPESLLQEEAPLKVGQSVLRAGLDPEAFHRAIKHLMALSQSDSNESQDEDFNQKYSNGKTTETLS